MKFINLFISEKSLMDFSCDLSKYWWSEWESAVVKTNPAVCAPPLHFNLGMYLTLTTSPSENLAIQTTHLRFQEYLQIAFEKLRLLALFKSKLAWCGWSIIVTIALIAKKKVNQCCISVCGFMVYWVTVHRLTVYWVSKELNDSPTLYYFLIWGKKKTCWSLKGFLLVIYRTSKAHTLQASGWMSFSGCILQQNYSLHRSSVRGGKPRSEGYKIIQQISCTSAKTVTPVPTCHLVLDGVLWLRGSLAVSSFVLYRYIDQIPVEVLKDCVQDPEIR